MTSHMAPEKVPKHLATAFKRLWIYRRAALDQP